MFCIGWFSPLKVTTCHDDLQETYLFRSCHQCSLLHRSTWENPLHPHMCHGRNTWLCHRCRNLQSNFKCKGTIRYNCIFVDIIANIFLYMHSSNDYEQSATGLSFLTLRHIEDHHFELHKSSYIGEYFSSILELPDHILYTKCSPN